MGPLVAPLIQAGSQGLNNIFELFTNRRTNRYNREMADYAYQKDLDMWNRSNAYNTPAMQMQRFEDAGLNKHLIYSQGQPGQAAASMPKYQDVHGTFGTQGLNVNNALSAINAYQDYQIKQAQTDLIKAQKRNAELTGDLTFWNTFLAEGKARWTYPTEGMLITDADKGVLGADTFGLKSWAQYSSDFKEKQLRQQQATLEKTISGTKLNSLQADWLSKKLKVMNDANINIDKDSIMSRFIADIFGDIIKKYSGALTRKINLNF